MDTPLIIEKYNRLIDQSYLGLWKRKFKSELTIEDFDNFPISLFDIGKIYVSITNSIEFDNLLKRKISDRLIDIKTLFFYLKNSTDRFYFETFEIIENGELEKANENTMSWLQLTHYKVYLISSIYEKLIDLFEIIYLQKSTDHKNNKIGKKLEKLWELTNFNLVTKIENQVLTEFRNSKRKGEMHGTSSIFRQLFKEEWNHLSNEENIINEIIKKFYSEYNKDCAK